MAKVLSNTEIVTGEVRLSYAHLFTPTLPANARPGQQAKYSVCLLIDKKDEKTLSLIRDAVKHAYEAGIPSKFGGKAPKKWHDPLRDGDAEKDLDENPEYAGCYFINCSSQRKPGLVDRRGVEIIDPDGIKSGDYAKADINFFPYSNTGNSGVGCAVNNVLKTRDGEPLGGTGFSAEAAFAGELLDGDDDDDPI
jgi:hypothetical protein